MTSSISVLIFIVGYVVIFVMLPVLGIWYRNSKDSLIDRLLICFGVGILPVGFLVTLCIGG